MKTGSTEVVHFKGHDLLEALLGKYVYIYTTSTINNHEEDGEVIRHSQGPLVVEGYLLALDLDFIYIGEVRDKINRCLNKHNIIMLEITRPKSKEEKDSESFHPIDKKELN